MQKHLSIYFVILIRFLLYTCVRTAAHDGRCSLSVRMDKYSIAISLLSVNIIAGLEELRAMQACMKERSAAGLPAAELREEAKMLVSLLNESFAVMADGEQAEA